MDDWDVLSELSLKDGEKVFLSTNANKAVFVGEFGPDAHLAVVLECAT